MIQEFMTQVHMQTVVVKKVVPRFRELTPPRLFDQPYIQSSYLKQVGPGVPLHDGLPRARVVVPSPPAVRLPGVELLVERHRLRVSRPLQMCDQMRLIVTRCDQQLYDLISCYLQVVHEQDLLRAGPVRPLQEVDELPLLHQHQRHLEDRVELAELLCAVVEVLHHLGGVGRVPPLALVLEGLVHHAVGHQDGHVELDGGKVGNLLK